MTLEVGSKASNVLYRIISSDPQTKKIVLGHLKYLKVLTRYFYLVERVQKDVLVTDVHYTNKKIQTIILRKT